MSINNVIYKKIGELANYRRGSFPQPYTNDKYYGGEESMPFVQVADIQDNFQLVDKTKNTISKLAQPLSVFVPKNTLLVTLQGSIGKVAITQYDCYVDRTIAIFENLSDEVDIKYFAYQLKNKFEYEKQFARGSTIKTITKEEMTNFEIPIPSIEIQKSIVRQLDKFEELIDLKKIELEKREKQYKYVIQKLLFSSAYETKNISELCKITKGSTPIQKAIPGEFPLVVTTSERKTSNSYQFDTEAVCIPLVSSRGHGIASLNHVYYQEGKFALGNILCALEPLDKKVLLTKYLFYYFENTKDYTLVPLMKGGANVALHMNDIYNVQISLPSIKKQNEIIEKFDIFSNYISNLLKEIEQRKKQYDYYRNKLLNFEEMVVNE